MAKLKKEDFINGLKEMTILEVKELVDAMKEEFGVDPSAVSAAPAAATAAEEKPSTQTVVLKSAGGNKIAVIKIIKEVTGLGLVEAKGVADNGGNIKENIPTEEAEALKKQLEEAGATVELK
jgi:large subunit ribosomal protein L7/L12